MVLAPSSASKSSFLGSVELRSDLSNARILLFRPIDKGVPQSVIAKVTINAVDDDSVIRTTIVASNRIFVIEQNSCRPLVTYSLIDQSKILDIERLRHNRGYLQEELGDVFSLFIYNS